MIPVLSSLDIKKNESKTNIYLEATSLLQIDICCSHIEDWLS